MLTLQTLLLVTTTLVTAAKETAAFLLPRTVWCRMEPAGGFHVISTRPDGPAVPHGATMAMPDRRGETSVAYYYPVPTPLLEALGQIGVGPTADLLATGRETTTKTGRWREFRRSGAAEFEAALARWRGR